MIVKSHIKVYSGLPAGVISNSRVAPIRWPCDVLIDDELLGEQILIVARAQAGFGVDNVGNRITMEWARCVVIKDCIAAARPGAARGIDAANAESHAVQCPVHERPVSHLQAPVNSLGPHLRKLPLLPRFASSRGLLVPADFSFARHK